MLGASDRLIEPCAEGTQVHIHHAADTSSLDGGKCVDHEAKRSTLSPLQKGILWDAFLLGASDRLIEPCAEGTQVHIRHEAAISSLDGGKCVDHEAKRSTLSILQKRPPRRSFSIEVMV